MIWIESSHSSSAPDVNLPVQPTLIHAALDKRIMGIDDAKRFVSTRMALKACAARLSRAHTFAPGQLVRWKKGLKNRRTPAYGEPVVVIEVLDPPVFDPQEQDPGSSYFREPLTLVAGEVYPGEQFLSFYYDARRFEPYRE